MNKKYDKISSLMSGLVEKKSSGERNRLAELCDYFIMLVIVINAVILFIQDSGINTKAVQIIDAVCIIIFILEMSLKIVAYSFYKSRESKEDSGFSLIGGFKEYWRDGWNKLDFVLVILSIPALLSYILPISLGVLSSVLVLRVLRIFRFLRVFELFTNLGSIMSNLANAIKDSSPIFLGFMILIFFFAILSCDLFKDISPKYFGTPLDAIYSTFRICTTEGWYDIPDSLSGSLSEGQLVWVRSYFVFIVIAGGIIGLSLVNSIFVNAMLNDDNKSMKNQISDLTKKIDELNQKIDNLTDK